MGFQLGHIGYWRGKKMHPNTRKALAIALKGNKHTLGKKLSEKVKEGLRLRNIGNKYNLGRIPSLETRDKMSESHRGEKAYQWKGGITPINQKIRSSRQYDLWEKAVISRDNGCCRKCGREEKLVAHHILNFATYVELRFDLNNGITLCQRCHGWFHREYGRKNNSQEQINNFIELWKKPQT